MRIRLHLPKHNVLLGNGSYADPEDNYANAWLNHLYIYADLEGSNPNNTSAEKDKIRLGLRNQNASTAFATVLPQNSGPAFHPMGPGSTPGLQNVLTFSGDTGTVVFTQMKVLENLPVMLTSPRIWEALGLPLDPFEDTINFFGDPGKITEETIRPYVQMKAALHNYDPTPTGRDRYCGAAEWQAGHRHGRCPDRYPQLRALPFAPRQRRLAEQREQPEQSAEPMSIVPTRRRRCSSSTISGTRITTSIPQAGDSDWYSRLKAAAISILSIHDNEHRTDFTLNYPQTGGNPPQLTRLGHESVLCQRCHADNVIAVVKSASTPGELDPAADRGPSQQSQRPPVRRLERPQRRVPGLPSGPPFRWRSQQLSDHPRSD